MFFGKKKVQGTIVTVKSVMIKAFTVRENLRKIKYKIFSFMKTYNNSLKLMVLNCHK